MAASEFEKKLRSQMDEFRLHPSGEVWEHVEEKIRERKRKRRIFFLLVTSLVAIGLAGYGISHLTNKKSPLQQNEIAVQKQTTPTKEKLPGTTNVKTATTDRPTNNKTDEAARKINAPSNEKIPGATVKAKVAGKGLKENNVDPTTGSKIKRPGNDVTIEKTLANNQNKNKDNQKDLYKAPNELNQSPVTLKNADSTTMSAQQKTSGDVTAVVPVLKNAEKVNAGEKIAKDSADNIAGKEAPTITSDSNTVTAMTKTEPALPQQKINQRKKNKISWGITAAIGASSISDDRFSLKNAYGNSADQLYNAPGNVGAGGGSGGPVATTQPSETSPVAGFSIGISAKKIISKRSTLVVGLNYTNAGDKIRVGSRQFAAAQSAFAGTLNNYYRGVALRDYKDRFHFISLPIQYSWRLGNNEQNYFSISAGVSPAVLLSTNALIYDTAAGGIYYHKSSMMRKVFADLRSGIAYNWRMGKNLEWSIGPQFSFGLTKFSKENLDRRKYFLFSGIETRIFFSQKK